MNLYTADEYERQVIAAILWHFYGPEKVMDGLAEAGLTASDFRHPLAQAAYTAAVALGQDASIEVPSLAVADWLAKHPDQLPGCPCNAQTLTTAFPPGQALPSDLFYEEAVTSIKRASAAQREVDRANRLLMAAESDSMDPDEIAEMADQIAAEREAEQDREAEGPVSGDRAIAETMQAIQDRRDNGVPIACVPTGYSDIDNWLDGGLYPGTLSIVAARPSVGKTALAINIMAHGADRTATLIDSLEMPTRDVMTRAMSILSGIPAGRIKGGRLDSAEMGAVREAMRMLAVPSIGVDDEGGMSLLDLCRRARVWFRRRKASSGLLIVDYLQLVTVPDRKGATRENEVSRVSSALKALAKRCDIPVLALCQLSRAAEHAGRPGLHHLRESGSIEQDADAVLILHRDRRERADGTFGLVDETELILAKNRNGPVGTARLTFAPATNVFRDGRQIDDADIPHHRPSGGKRAPDWM